MQLLDGSDTEGWAATFTPDGVFAAGGVPEPVRGRETIALAARAVADQFADAEIARRHWIGMLTVDRRDADTVDARCYAPVLEIPAGGEVIVRRSTVCDDVLVQGPDGWLVAYRTVTRDGLD